MKALEKKFGAPPLTAEDVGEDKDPLVGAAKDILEAIKDDDADALATALKLAHEICQDEYGKDDKEETDEEG